MAPNQVIGCLQTPGASRRRALRGFFSAKKASGNQIMRIYYKICVFVCFCKKNLDFLRFVENWTPNSEQMCLFARACA